MGQPSAGPVHVLVGHSQGQGYTFTLGRSCYAYTAGHVLSRPGGSVLLTNRQAFQAKARVIAIDSRLDLGLLQVDPDGMRPSKVCDGGTPQLIQPGALMSAARTGLPDVWMDTIASQSGELDRLELSLRPEGIGETRLLLSPTSGNKRRVESRTPQSGDSGASVFGSPRDSERGRYGADGTPTARQVGLLLGVHVGVKGDQSVAVRADVLHEFVFQALQPVVWEKIKIAPAHVKLHRYRRGVFPAESRDQYWQLTAQGLDHVTLELDLGERDFSLTGVSVETGGLGGGAASTRRPPSIRVLTSQFQPSGDAKVRWERGACDAAPARRQSGSTGAPTSLRCSLSAQRNTRGLRLEFIGNPSELKSVTLLAEPRQ